jgi:Tfp pilus assembly protein PilV
MRTAVAAENNRLRGSTIIEVMLAVLIMVIAVIGVSSSFVSGRRFVVDQRYYQAAAQLASQKLEELKAAGYDNINTGQEEEELTVGQQPYLRRTQIVLTATPTTDVPKPCKKAAVTIQWTLYGLDVHEATLITYIGP